MPKAIDSVAGLFSGKSTRKETVIIEPYQPSGELVHPLIALLRQDLSMDVCLARGVVEDYFNLINCTNGVTGSKSKIKSDATHVVGVMDFPRHTIFVRYTDLEKEFDFILPPMLYEGYREDNIVRLTKNFVSSRFPDRRGFSEHLFSLLI